MMPVKHRDQSFRDQPMLFDEESATTPTQTDDVRKAAIERADQNADALWKRAAADCLHQVAQQKFELTADDVLELLERQLVQTHNLAALGPVFVRAAKQGWIQNTDRMVQSRIPRRHRKITVWKSLIVEAQRR